MAKAVKEVKEEPIEKQLWKAADKLRKNIDAAEYKHVVLGLMFLKYISDSFEEMYTRLQKGEGEYAGADPEDKDEYKAENIFFVPTVARWSFLLASARQPDIGTSVDEAMDIIEKENPMLKGVLPKVYARQNLDPASLGGLIDLMGNIALGDARSRSRDVLGHVFEYFLGEFALAEGTKGGQFYTPRSVVELLVAMVQPYKGRVFDPCCGSGGMFVQSERFIKEHQGLVNDISIYGQESNQTTWRLAKMNLAIRGIDSSQVKWNNEGSFLNDAHKDLKSDFIISNPPFNDSDWSGKLLRIDGRWKYGIPPVSNANFAWLQHFIYHLAPSGTAAIVLAIMALSSDNEAEALIRKGIVDDDIVEAIVTLPGKLFFSTPIPVSIWVISRNKTAGKFHDRRNKTLFIDASRHSREESRTHSVLTDKDILHIATTFNAWRSNQHSVIYEDQPGFCREVAQEEIQENNYSLFPAAYIAAPLAENVDNSTDLVPSFTERLQSEFEKSKIRRAKTLDLLTNLKCFDGIPYSGNLETFKLSDILDLSDEILGDRDEPEILTCTENAGIVLQRERFSKRVATLDTSSYKAVYFKDIVYNPYLLWAGAIDQCTVVDFGITSPAYAVFKIKDSFDPFLVGRVLSGAVMLHKYNGISVGTVQRRRRAPIEKFLDLEVDLPPQTEQRIFSEISQQLFIEANGMRNTIRSIEDFFNTLAAHSSK